MLIIVFFNKTRMLTLDMLIPLTPVTSFSHNERDLCE